MIGSAGLSSPPGAGETSATGNVPCGNQLTLAGAPSRSQLRGAAATSSVPVTAWTPNETRRPSTSAGCIAPETP